MHIVHGDQVYTAVKAKLEELGNYLKRMELEKGNLLYLQADKDVAYGTVVKVMEDSYKFLLKMLRENPLS